METEEGVGRHGAERESILATQPVDEAGAVLRSRAAAGVYPASEQQLEYATSDLDTDTARCFGRGESIKINIIHDCRC